MTVFKGCLHPWTAAGAGPCAARLLSATRQAARYDCSDAQFGAKIWCSVKQLACKSSMPTRVYQGEKNKRIRTECRNEEGAKAEADDNVIVAASAAEMLLPQQPGKTKVRAAGARHMSAWSGSARHKMPGSYLSCRLGKRQATQGRNDMHWVDTAYS